MAENLKPAIRFAGFTDAWEQRKLGELGSVAMCRRIFKEQTSDEGDVPFYKIGTFGGEADAFISRELFEEYKQKYPYPEKGAILISASGSIGRTVVLTGENEYFQDSNIVWLKHDSRLLDDFLKYVYEGIKWAGIEGSTIQRLYNDNILKTEINLPNIQEQAAIGTYFKELDHLITLHQRKCDKLSNVKKSMLEKMFPKNGSNVPEIRFAGFTDAWEQRRLGAIATEVNRNDPTSIAPIMMITANNGFIEQSERYAFNNAGESLKKYILLEKGELAYNHGASKLRPYGSCFALTNEENARIPFVYHCFDVGENDSEFVSIELNGADIEEQLRKIVSSGARMDGLLNISYEEYSNVMLKLPSIREQQTISAFFRSLDHLITLHQRKLEKLQNIKKSCLEKMFV
ncbi:MAG: restriction endonuclease subunit S [Anaerovoracaceae bacterium]